MLDIRVRQERIRSKCATFIVAGMVVLGHVFVNSIVGSKNEDEHALLRAKRIPKYTPQDPYAHRKHGCVPRMSSDYHVSLLRLCVSTI